jgi:hypothetical protein
VANATWLVENNYLHAFYSTFFTGGGTSTGHLPEHTGVIQASPAPTIGTVRLDVVTDLAIGDYLALQVPAYAPDNWVYSVGQVTGISGLDVTFDPVSQGTQTFPGAPSVGGAAFWRGLNVNGITIRKNYIEAVRQEQADSAVSPKGFLEFKSAVDILIEGNYFTCADPTSGESKGAPIALTYVGSSSDPWVTQSNVIIRNNWCYNLSRIMLGPQGYFVQVDQTNITVTNNVLEKEGGYGTHLFSANTCDSMTITHNTCLQPGTGEGGSHAFLITSVEPLTNFVCRDNIMAKLTYGWQDDVTGDAWPSVVNTYNCYVGGTNEMGTGSVYPASYAAVNFTNLAGRNYRLASNSPGYQAASDADDIGADIDAVLAAMAATDRPIS